MPLHKLICVGLAIFLATLEPLAANPAAPPPLPPTREPQAEATAYQAPIVSGAVNPRRKSKLHHLKTKPDLDLIGDAEPE